MKQDGGRHFRDGAKGMKRDFDHDNLKKSKKFQGESNEFGQKKADFN
jgi:hypothetical protein